MEDMLCLLGGPKEIGDAMVYLLDRPEIAQRMGEAGRSKTLARYSWEIIAGQVESFYQLATRVLDGCPSALA